MEKLTFQETGRQCIAYNSPHAEMLMLQPVDEHDRGERLAGRPHAMGGATCLRENALWRRGRSHLVVHHRPPAAGIAGIRLGRPGHDAAWSWRLLLGRAVRPLGWISVGTVRRHRGRLALGLVRQLDGLCRHTPSSCTIHLPESG